MCIRDSILINKMCGFTDASGCRGSENRENVHELLIQLCILTEEIKDD